MFKGHIDVFVFRDSKTAYVISNVNNINYKL